MFKEIVVSCIIFLSIPGVSIAVNKNAIKEIKVDRPVITTNDYYANLSCHSGMEKINCDPDNISELKNIGEINNLIDVLKSLVESLNKWNRK
jgi:hypothetical protein